MTAPVRPAPIRTTDADLYDSLVERGLSPEQAALHVSRRSNARERFLAGSAEDRAEVEPSALASGVGGLLQGGGLGTGEVFSGLGGAITGKGFREGAQSYRDALSDLEAANPNLAAASEIGGSLALPGAQVGGTLAKGVQAGVPLGIGGTLGLLGKAAVAGGVPSAIGGFSAGGEDPGDFGARLTGGVKSGLEGAALSALLAGLALPAIRQHVEASADVAQKGRQRDLTQTRLENARLRNERLQKSAQPAARLSRRAPRASLVEHVAAGPLEDIEQAIGDFKAGRISQEDLDVALNMAGKTDRVPSPLEPHATPISEGPPGSGTEQLAPIPESAGRGFEVTGTRATPAIPKSPTLLEMQQGLTQQGMARGEMPANHWSSGQITPDPQLNPDMAVKQLKSLLTASDAEFAAASPMLDPNARMLAEELRAAGATPSDVEKFLTDQLRAHLSRAGR